MYDIYLNLFSEAATSNVEVVRLRSFQLTYGCVFLLRDASFLAFNGDRKFEEMGSHCLAVSLSSTGQANVLNFSPVTPSFHGNANPREVQKASGLLQNLMSRAYQLLTAFPGHEVLIALGQVAEYVRKLELTTTSVAKALRALEIVLRKAQEWEQHASERVKLGSCLVEISQLVATWRRMELQSWEALLESREERFVKRARRHWIRLYSLLNKGSKGDEQIQLVSKRKDRHEIASWIWRGMGRRSEKTEDQGSDVRLEGLAKAIDTFILTSTVGEFQERLGLIKSFAHQFALYSDAHGLSLFRLLISVGTYYSQFTAFLQSWRQKMKNPIWNRLKDEVKLAKWDEQSYYSLLDSTERNHRKLMKLLREYDNVLETSVVSLLEQYFCDGVRSLDGTAPLHRVKLPSNKELFPLESDAADKLDAQKMSMSSVKVESRKRTWAADTYSNTSPLYDIVHQLPRYHRKMHKFIFTGLIGSPSPARAGQISSAQLCTNIFKRIESLRQDKITKQMKQRALADLFRVLKKNGFKSSKWAIPAQLRQMMFVFQLPVPPSTSFPLDSTWQLSELEKAEVYFQKVLSESRRLRSEVSMSGSIYMTAREMEVMSNFSDHGLFLISQQRSIIADAAPALSTFKKHVETLCSLKGGVPRCQRELLDRIREFELALGSSQECICQLKLIVESSLYLEENDEAKSAKRDTLSLIDECLVQLKANHVAFETEIVTSASLEQLRKVREVLSIIVGHLNSCSDLNRMCLPCDAFDTTIECVQKAIHLSLKCNASTKELEDIVPEKERIESFLRTTKKTIESALILIQKVYKLRECGERNIDDSEGDDIDTTLIWDNHKQVCSELNDLNIKGIAHECKEVIDCIVSMSESVVTKEDQKLVLSVASDATEILVLVLCVFEAWMEDTVSFFRSCAKLQYVLCRIFRALVANGYCHDSTIEENARNEGEGDTGGMKFEDNIEGTGMGEGEGKEDVTDQLESEEQLLGLKDEKPKEKNTEKSDESKKLDEEEALKGMEMEADFEGDLFDVPDEQNDKEDERESDNEEELDREMGEGPNESEDVVDEKLWGDSDNEEEINHKEEKFEKDSKVKGESIEETRTKDKEEPPENSDQTDTEDRSDKNQQNMDDEADPAVEINEDREERYEDKHAGIDAREDEVDNGIIDEEMNLDDDIELDRENEDSDSEQETTDKIDQPEDDDDDNAAKTRVDESSLADENENPDDTDAMDTDADPAGASGVPEGEDDKGGQDDEEAPKVNQSSTTPASELTYGVQSNNGKDNIQNEPNENNQEEVTEEGGKGQKEENREFNETSHQDNPSGSGGTDGRDGIQNEGYARNATNLQQSNAPNPFKDPGEANKFWHKKLKMVSRASKEIEGDESGQEEDSPAENEKEKDVDFEYAAKNEASSTQVLGEVTEETSGTNFNDELHEDRDNENEAKPPQADMDHFREEDQHPSHKTTQPSSLSKDSTAQPMDDEDDEGDNEEQGEKSQDDADNLEVLDQTGEEIDRENKVVSDLTQIRLEDEDVEMAEAGNIVEEEQITGISSMEITESRARWNKIAGETHNLSRRLCEKLRLVMEPLVATKLKGDYRSGKRINMKKVISFIASEYRKDKIWLRRTKPAKRNYRILLAVDNSESMSKNGAGEMALSAMATLAVGMGQLEIGELGIASFGDEMKLLHPFHLPFASEHGATLVHNFSFDEKRTRTALCVESALTAMGMSGDHASLQLVFVISDGRIERDSRATLRRLMREMVERNILLVMIVVEGDGVSKKKKDSIVHMKEVTFENGRPKVRQFIEDYPFPYYIILDDMHALPEVLGDALRQWFEMIAQLQQYR
jgi:midasin (ATPase involved in ribosome maturation)